MSLMTRALDNTANLQNKNKNDYVDISPNLMHKIYKINQYSHKCNSQVEIICLAPFTIHNTQSSCSEMNYVQS